MKNKPERNRQEVIKRILRTHGSVDRVDTVCLSVRFKCSPEVIAEDVPTIRESLKQEVLVQQRVPACQGGEATMQRVYFGIFCKIEPPARFCTPSLSGFIIE
jgi:hypothetical protein